MEVLPISNTRTNDLYQTYCREHNIPPHPARMQSELAKFFIEFLTTKNDLVLDPFAGSNTTGYVAENLKRKWVSVELDSTYVQASEIRFK
ncbi:MAG: DNA methyltransferase [Dehalococcoidia bacterium]